MTMRLKDIEADALQLAPEKCNTPFRSMIVSLDSEPGDTREAIARSRDEVIARRLEAIERGDVEWISGEEALAWLDAAARGNR